MGICPDTKFHRSWTKNVDVRTGGRTDIFLNFEAVFIGSSLNNRSDYLTMSLIGVPPIEI